MSPALNGYELGRERFPGRAHESCPPQSPQKRERVPQDMFDPILQRFVRSFAHVRAALSDRAHRVRGNDRRVIAQLLDHRTGETRAVAAGYLVGTDGGGSLVRERLGITMSGNPALTYTTNVLFRCADFDALHDKDGPTASSSSGRRARGSPSWRSTAASAIACRSSARPTRSPTARPISAMRCGARSGATSTMSCCRSCLGAARAHRRPLRQRSCVHRRRRRPSDVADRRFRHEHRHPGRGRPRLEARGQRARLGRARAVALLSRASGVRLRSATSSEASSQSGAHARDPGSPAAAGDFPTRAGRRRRPRRLWPLVHGDHAARMVHHRLSSRLSLRQLADHRAGRHAGAAAGNVDLYPERAARRPRAACVAAGRPLDPRSVRSRLHPAAARRARRRTVRAFATRRRRPACRSA